MASAKASSGGRAAGGGQKALTSYRAALNDLAQAEERNRAYPTFSSQEDWQYDGPHGPKAPKTYAEYQDRARAFRADVKEKRAKADAIANKLFRGGKGRLAAQLHPLEAEVNAQWGARNAWQRALMPGWNE